MEKEKVVRITVGVPIDCYDVVKQTAKKQDRSISWVIREAFIKLFRKGMK